MGFKHWVAPRWYDRTDPSRPVTLQSSMRAAGDPSVAPEYLLVRTDTAPDGAKVVLSEADGTVLDRSTVGNGVAVLVLEAQGFRSIDNVRVSLSTPDGTATAPSPLAVWDGVPSAECGPGEAPARPLPEPGRQPRDPDASDAQIRGRHALLVDRSIPFDQKPTGLLDDDTGVQDAIATMDAGPYRDAAASARYTIGELVFTSPVEAWFRYTITTSSETYVGRFGMAVLGDAGVADHPGHHLSGSGRGRSALPAGTDPDRAASVTRVGGSVAGLDGPSQSLLGRRRLPSTLAVLTATVTACPTSHDITSTASTLPGG